MEDMAAIHVLTLRLRQLGMFPPELAMEVAHSAPDLSAGMAAHQPSSANSWALQISETYKHRHLRAVVVMAGWALMEETEPQENLDSETPCLLMEMANQIQDAFFFNLAGGAGGNSQNGSGGLGGTARFNIGSMQGLIPTDKSSNHQYYVNVVAGSGGKATASATQSGNGGRGAVAFLHAGDKLTTTNNGLFTQFDVRAGYGGSALGRRGSGNGGFGGKAGVRGTQVFESIGTGNSASLSIQFSARGGEGGHAQGTGTAGNGGDAVFDNHFTIRNQANAQLYVSTFGGNGGWGRNNGFGGDAKIKVVEAFELPDGQEIDPAQRIFQSYWAQAGNAGLGVEPNRVAHGGNATIEMSETDNRGIFARGNAFAGTGNWGRSGDSIVDLTANVVEGAVLPTYKDANLFANANRQIRTNVRAAYGSNAVAKTNAKSEIGTARATSQSLSGWGFIASGHADSMATADGAADAFATARSDALGDRDNDTNNYSSSRSMAIGTGFANAYSDAGSQGKVELTRATAYARARQAGATSLVDSLTTNWRSAGRMNLRSNFIASGELGTASTAASMRFLSDTPTEFQNATIEAHVDLMPEQMVADSFVTDNSTFGSIFVDDATADILGIGTFHGGMADGDEGRLEVTAKVDFMLETRHWFNDQQLMFGLVSLENQGIGFSSMYASLQFGDQELFTETFEDGDEANQFFDNMLLDLGSMPFAREPIQFDFEISMIFEDSADQFGFGFVFGNANGLQNPGPLNFSAVPEPGSAGLVGLLLMAAFARRRK